MCSMSVLKCPLCAQTSFPSIDALRGSLIKAANGPLACPICHEQFLGLDKLTIHLFSHTSDFTDREGINSPTTTKTTETLQQPASPNGAAASVNVTVTKRPSKEKKTKKAKQQTLDIPQKTIPESANTHNSGTISTNNNSNNTSDTLSTCDICEFTFRDAELRDMHFRLVHQNPSSNNSSNECASSSVPPGAEFKCHLCAKTFKMKGSLRVHLKVVHFMSLPSAGGSGNAKLSICDRIRFKETAKSKANTNIKSNSFSKAPSIESGPSMMPAVPQTTTQIATMPSGFTFGTLTLLPATTTGTSTGQVLNINSNGELVHASDATALNSNVLLVFNANATAAATASAPVPLQTLGGETLDGDGQGKCGADNPKIWECDVCSKSFTTKYFLKKHKRLHTGEMPYTCEICARTFTFQQSYHKHLLYHSNEKPHVCSTCGRAFKELSTLHNHERIHSGEKPFKCEVCGKCFRQRVSFLVHTRIHTGVMPYKCEVCQKSFRYKVSQRTHKCPALEAVEANNSASTTDQISENFIKAFLESTSAQLSESQQSPASAEIAGINAGHECQQNVGVVADADEDLLSKTIDDIMVESCNKMGIGRESSNRGLSNMPSPRQVVSLAHNEGSNSPSQKLQNMRLYSPQLEAASSAATEAVEMCEGDDGVGGIFSRFLLDDVL